MKLDDLTQAARAAAPAPPLSDERKRAILARVHAEAPEPRSFWTQLGAGARAFAAVPVASLLMLLGLFAWRALGPATAPSTTPPHAAAQREVLAPGVELVRLRDTDADVKVAGDEVRIALRHGALAAELESGADRGLRFSTPRAEVIVRGTVLYVESDARATRVGVVSGLVEVQPKGGETLWVRAGETIAVEDEARTSRSAHTSRLPPSELHRTVAALWPDHVPALAPNAAAKLEPPSAAPLAPDAARAAAPEVAPAVEPLLPKPAAKAVAPQREAEAKASDPRLPQSEVLALARTAWVRGERAPAISSLEAWIARASADENLDEPHYLLASFLRAERSYDQAVRVLETLTQSPRSATARLAALERARILEGHLGRRAEAMRALRELSAPPASDGISPQALLELCRLHVSAAEWQAARDCLNELDERFPNAPEAQPAAALRRKLPARPR